jgi:hypothetical protein
MMKNKEQEIVIYLFVCVYAFKYVLIGPFIHALIHSFFI